MRGACIDPTYPEGTPSGKAALLVRRYRMVLFANSLDTVDNFINSGTYVHGVIASNSGDPAFFANWGMPNFDVTVGNEPTTVSDSSWTMSPSAYGDLWQATANYAAPRWIGGFADGNPASVEPYLRVAPDAAGIDIHLYTLNPDELVQRIADYRSLGLPVRVGEWHMSGDLRYGDYWFPQDIDDNVYCYSDAMGAGFGVFA